MDIVSKIARFHLSNLWKKLSTYLTFQQRVNVHMDNSGRWSPIPVCVDL